jgi:1-acyl-sn-glycerol-3-phosphate acyltransferase
MLGKWLWKIWFVYACLIFALVMLVCFPLAAAAYGLGEKWGSKVSCFFLRTWGWLFSLLIGIRYKVSGREKLPENPVGVYVSNHRSFLDTPAAYLSIPTRFKPLGKVEMQKAPFFGWFYPSVVILVDRGSNESRRKSMLEMKRSLAAGLSVFIFPEGSMNRSAEPLNTFYEGAFHLAVDMQVPVFPMVIKNSARLLPPETANVYPGKIEIRFLNPLPTQGMTRADILPLRDKTAAFIREAYEQNRQTVEV